MVQLHCAAPLGLCYYWAADAQSYALPSHFPITDIVEPAGSVTGQLKAAGCGRVKW